MTLKDNLDISYLLNSQKILKDNFPLFVYDLESEDIKNYIKQFTDIEESIKENQIRTDYVINICEKYQDFTRFINGYAKLEFKMEVEEKDQKEIDNRKVSFEFKPLNTFPSGKKIEKDEKVQFPTNIKEPFNCLSLDDRFYLIFYAIYYAGSLKEEEIVEVMTKFDNIVSNYMILTLIFDDDAKFDLNKNGECQFYIPKNSESDDVPYNTH